MSTLADHYAEALADIALEKNSAVQIRQELLDFSAMLEESPELRTLLTSPAVPRTGKQSLVETLVARMGASQTLRNFLSVILDRRRMALLPEIQSAFDAQIDKRRGIMRAVVTSATDLSEAEKVQLRAVLERISGHSVEIEYRLDSSLIAGAVVRIGSTIYDGSVRTQLERLRFRLATN